MKKSVIQIFFLLSFVLMGIYGNADNVFGYETGTPFIRNYPPREYKAFSQNWSIVQDSRGVVYFANGDGVLEYDGVNWRLIRITNNYTASALAIDTGGVIFVGSIDEFGFLAPNSRGIMSYYSLSENLKPDKKDFGFINDLGICKNNNIFINTSSGVYKLIIDEDVTDLKKINNVISFYHADDKMYFYDPESGLNILYNDSIVPLYGGSFFKGKGINTILDYDDSHLLVSTVNDGIFIINKTDPNNYYKRLHVEKFKTQIDAFLLINRFNYALKLHNGHFAFATRRGGTIIIDKDGVVIQILNKQTGIYNDTHYYIFQDSENAIWLALDNGISKAEINAPLTFWNDATGLKGSILAITRFNNTLYCATWQGVFALNMHETNYGNEHNRQLDPVFFNSIEGISNTAWAFLEISDGDASPVLLIASSDGIYSLSATHELKKIYSGNANKLYRLKSPNDIIMVGLDNGALPIKIEKQNGSFDFVIMPLIPGTMDRVISIGQTEGGEIWLGTQYKGLMLLTENNNNSDTISYNFNVKPVRKYKNKDIGGSVYISTFRNRLLFSSENGLFYFNDDGGINPFCKIANRTIDGKAVITIFEEKHNGNLILQYALMNKGEKIIAEVAIRNNYFKIITHPYKPIPQAEIWTIFSEFNNITWLGGDEGLYRLNNNIDYFYTKPFETLIRKIMLEDDSVYFGGNECNVNAAFYSCADVENKESGKNIFDFKFNSVVFEYASLFFYDEAQNKYQYQLKGFDKRLSDWTNETKKEYTNLPNGKYVFEVRSKNIFDQISDFATFEFEILPPWYRTIWAYLCYVIFLGCVIYLSVKYSNRRLIQAKIRLEDFVQERTAEIISQKRELEKEKEKSDRLLLNILPYKIAEELKEKGYAKAKYYEMVSVMFADFSGFTQIAEVMEPEELIKELNHCFMFFDEVCVRNNLEKIKTVGDSYMCAGGVPIKNNTNPIDIIIAALEIIQFINNLDKEQSERNQTKWQIRIGINTGEIIAGVVGKKKFAYDIWGDTVNTASRMETTSDLNKINISGKTYEYVKDLFVCTYRGKVPAKHKGEVDMYFVERIKPEYSNDEFGLVPNLMFKEFYNKLNVL